MGILLAIIYINIICVRRVSIIFKSVNGIQRPMHLRTCDEAFQFIFHNVSRIIFLKISIVSYHCIPQIMPTALLNLQSEVQCSVIWRAILNMIPRIFLYTLSCHAFAHPFVLLTLQEKSLYTSVILVQ